MNYHYDLVLGETGIYTLKVVPLCSSLDAVTMPLWLSTIFLTMAEVLHIYKSHTCVRWQVLQQLHHGFQSACRCTYGNNRKLAPGQSTRAGRIRSGSAFFSWHANNIRVLKKRNKRLKMGCAVRLFLSWIGYGDGIACNHKIFLERHGMAFLRG